MERVAPKGTRYERLPLYEPEHIQFYRLADIPFARELRKTGVNHAFPGVVSPRETASPEPAFSPGLVSP